MSSARRAVDASHGLNQSRPLGGLYLLTLSGRHLDWVDAVWAEKLAFFGRVRTGLKRIQSWSSLGLLEALCCFHDDSWVANGA